MTLTITRTSLLAFIVFLAHLTMCVNKLHAQTLPPEKVTVANRSYSAGESITHEAIREVNTSTTVTINSGATVAFEAGNTITLAPGFTAKAGATFHAKITYKYVEWIDPKTGIPSGLTRDSNGNTIPDLVEYKLGLDPGANNDGDTRIQQLKTNGKREYNYDATQRLLESTERTYQLDPEGNIIAQ